MCRLTIPKFLGLRNYPRISRVCLKSKPVSPAFSSHSAFLDFEIALWTANNVHVYRDVCGITHGKRGPGAFNGA